MAQQEALGKKKVEENGLSIEPQVMTKQTGNNSMARSNQNANIYLPDTRNDAYKFAEQVARSSFCPAAYRGKPADVYLAMAYGAQIGLNPLLAVQNIAVVNGRPSVYGDALTAIVMGHPETESYEDGYKDSETAYCRITRKGRTVYREFTVTMAKKAGLWGGNVWSKYPERMLLWRAKGNAIRDLYADVLMGMWTVEEAVDMPKTLEEDLQNITPREEQKPQPDPEKMVDKPKEEPMKAEQELKKESVEESDDASSIADMFEKASN